MYFRYRDRAKQLIDFSNIRYGALMPTDIDGLFEYKGKAVAIMEYKYLNAPMSDGQKLAYTRIADALERSGVTATVLLCIHNVDDPTNDIDAAKATVSQVYYKGKWKNLGDRTVKQSIDALKAYVDKIA